MEERESITKRYENLKSLLKEVELTEENYLYLKEILKKLKGGQKIWD